MYYTSIRPNAPTWYLHKMWNLLSWNKLWQMSNCFVYFVVYPKMTLSWNIKLEPEWTQKIWRFNICGHKMCMTFEYIAMFSSLGLHTVCCVRHPRYIRTWVLTEHICICIAFIPRLLSQQEFLCVYSWYEMLQGDVWLNKNNLALIDLCNGVNELGWLRKRGNDFANNRKLSLICSELYGFCAFIACCFVCYSRWIMAIYIIL